MSRINWDIPRRALSLSLAHAAPCVTQIRAWADTRGVGGFLHGIPNTGRFNTHSTALTSRSQTHTLLLLGILFQDLVITITHNNIVWSIHTWPFWVFIHLIRWKHVTKVPVHQFDLDTVVADGVRHTWMFYINLYRNLVKHQYCYYCILNTIVHIVIPIVCLYMYTSNGEIFKYMQNLSIWIVNIYCVWCASLHLEIYHLYIISYNKCHIYIHVKLLYYLCSPLYETHICLCMFLVKIISYSLVTITTCFYIIHISKLRYLWSCITWAKQSLKLKWKSLIHDEANVL